MKRQTDSGETLLADMTLTVGMYTILKTGMGPNSGNVGDQLVLEMAQELIEESTGIDEYRIYNRQTDITSVLDKVNETKAVILPAFEIRSDIVPYYQFSDDISDIEVPIIPMGAGWCEFPGDELHVANHRYSDKARSYLNHIHDGIDTFTTRDKFTSRVLASNGIDNTELIGDCAWYDLDKIGEPMSQPESIDKLVLTTPHRPLYKSQTKRLIEYLRSEFPDAELFCSLHNTPSEQDREIAEHATSFGYSVVRASLDTENIAFYEDCDLHVGYRLHGHIGFLRERNPSILIHEDGRGAGLTHTLGVGGFNGYRRRLPPILADLVRSTADTKLARAAHIIAETQFGVNDHWSNRIVAPADDQLIENIRSFLYREVETGFESYQRVAETIDDTYHNNMKPFLNSLPR